MTITFNFTADDNNLDDLQNFSEAMSDLNEFLALLNDRIDNVTIFEEDSTNADEQQIAWVENLLPYAFRKDLQGKQYSSEWVENFRDEITFEWRDVYKSLKKSFWFTGKENMEELQKLNEAING